MPPVPTAELPGLEALAVGGLPVAWWPASVGLDEARLAAGLHPAEEAEAARMKSAARRAEFRRARFLARLWTGRADALPRRETGVVTWPEGLVGSLTHKDGAVGMTLAPARLHRGVGLDVEDEARMKLAFEPRLCLPSESALLDDLAGANAERRLELLTALFSFKESVFKACFPLGGVMFHFHDARVTTLQSDAVTAELLKDVSPWTPAGGTITGARRRLAADGRRYTFTMATVPT